MDFLLQNIVWLAIAAGSGLALLWMSLRGDAGSVSLQDAVTLMNREQALVIDVREAPEFNSGHLPAARHVRMENLEKGFSDFDKFKSRPCVVYCERGMRAGKARKLLMARGFERVLVLDGGMEAWRNADMPIEK